MSQHPSASDIQRPFELSRRGFLRNIGVVGGAAAIGGMTANASADCAVGDTPQQRRSDSYQARLAAAKAERRGLTIQSCNGDEDLYANKIGSYSKGLPHNALGEVDLAAYQTLKDAVISGNPTDFENITLGLGRPLVNPQSGLAFDLEGSDSHRLAMPPAPAFSSAREAAEIAENYWMALLRDVPFADFGSNALVAAAAADLSAMSDFGGPLDGGAVTPGVLFRGFTAGDVVGPYISQFLYLPTPFGANYVSQLMQTPVAGIDFMTTYADWLTVQNGGATGASQSFEPARRHIINGRDLSQWVHIDVLFQAYFHAMLILLQPPTATSDPNAGGIGCPLNPGNPYNGSATQIGFGTFGGPNIAALMCEVATRALKAVWYQKWFVHRRLRPEMFAGRIHNHVTGATSYPIHSDILNSSALTEVFNANGTYLLPMVFPEGSPTHPAYGAGHATVAGACVTILKAMFDESFVIPNPVIPDPSDPTQLVPYTGGPLTVRDELNKLAANVAIGRNHAGVHWRSDYTESLKLGEAVAISILQDQRVTFNENFSGYTFTKFDGTTVTV